MSNQVLIVAPEVDARRHAEIARALRYEPVVTTSEDEALSLIGARAFRLVAISGNREWARLRAAAERQSPRPRVVTLPVDGDGPTVRSLLTGTPDGFPSEHSTFNRNRLLDRILASLSGSPDLREVVRTIVAITREEFAADGAWLLHPIAEGADFAKVAVTSFAPAAPVSPEMTLIPLGASSGLIRRTIDAQQPVAVHAGDPDLDADLARRFSIRSEMVQVLRPVEGDLWAFGLHQSTAHREWTAEERSTFAEIGRLATMALNNTILQARAASDVAKMNAMLDAIPEAAAIYDAGGKLVRMNAAASRDVSTVFNPDPAVRLTAGRHRYLDGKPLSPAELPSLRALHGENVKSDYLVTDPRSGDDRVMNLKAAPIRDHKGRVVGSVLLARDVTEERQNAEREGWRRRRAECLANLGIETVTVQPTFDNLDAPARRIAEAITGTAMIYLYNSALSELHMVGCASNGPKAQAVEQYREYLSRMPYHPGEGVAGTVFQIGRPLFFSDVRGTAVLDFARGDDDRVLLKQMDEQSLVACPIESYGDRIGALIIARSDDRRSLDADDLEFAQAIAERIGAAAHIHRLTRMSQEGHRAAEELARREVDARVRLEAVLENAPIGIAVISADELRFELANARFLDFAAEFGKITAEPKIVGLHVADVLPGFEKTLKVVAETAETRIDEAWEIGPKSDPRYINRVLSAVRGRFSGITQSLTVLVQDVTDEVRAKRQIEALADMMAERSARLDSILASMTDGLWVYDVSGAVVDVNQAALTMFGLGSRTEAIERASYQRLPLRYPDGRAVPPLDLPQSIALRGDTVPDYLAIGKHFISGRDIDLSIAAAPIESGGVVGAVLVMRDITALQELDRKKDEFLSVASHELRTPLTTIKGYTQLLSQAINELQPEERSTYLSAVLGEIDRMMGLISELLDVSRIETNRLQIHPQPIRWLDFLERRASAFRVQNPARNIRFKSEVDPALVISVDPDRMRQVVDNLLSNAVKYSSESTDIDVVVALDDGHMLTSVVDNGIGIPKDELPQLFERFHRARNVSSRYYGGLGLGLYISKAIVASHGGTITIESEEGKGSRFTVRLPLGA